MRMLRIGEGTKGEEGYTTRFGGKFTDLSRHPEENYGGSTAAGAYQIMRYTFWWLSGQELDENNKKTGIYKINHDYVKKYKIQDYKQESQDKLCLAIFKHKRPGIIEFVVKDKIEKAIRDIASLEWASLPHIGDNSKYNYKGKPQPATPIKKCLSDYEKFLKEELAEKSDLHLKKGFLKEFGFNCCDNEIKSQETTKVKYDIDKAVSYIKTHAEKKSTSLCAKYVRLAIEAGGLESSAVKRNAQNYLTILKDLGFTEEETTSYIKGDIVVFGIPKGHDNGHIAMYTGSEWISDFKQNSIIVNDVYTNAKKTIFRWK